MKVMLLNGSSHPDGCTALALRQAAKAIEEEGIETEIIFLGNAPMADCIACGHCRKAGQCVFDDIVNEIARKAGIKDHIGCHTLRKTFGYHYYKMTQDVVSLQRILCHSSRRETLIYIGVIQEEIDESLMKFNLTRRR